MKNTSRSLRDRWLDCERVRAQTGKQSRNQGPVLFPDLAPGKYREREFRKNFFSLFSLREWCIWLCKCDICMTVRSCFHERKENLRVQLHFSKWLSRIYFLSLLLVVNYPVLRHLGSLENFDFPSFWTFIWQVWVVFWRGRAREMGPEDYSDFDPLLLLY